MQRITSFFIAFFFTAAAWSQEAENAELTTEIGIKTTAFLDRLLDVDETEFAENPYLLTGKLAFGNLALRGGIGGSRSKDKKTEEGFADSQTTLNQHLDLRLGIERRFSLGGRWHGSVGMDATGFWSEDKTVEDSGFDVITVAEREKSFGGGLVAGIQIDLTKRLSLYTEGFAYYTFGTLTTGRYFKNFPIFDDKKEKTELESLKISLPSALFLVFRF